MEDLSVSASEKIDRPMADRSRSGSQSEGTGCLLSIAWAVGGFLVIYAIASVLVEQPSHQGEQYNQGGASNAAEAVGEAPNPGIAPNERFSPIRAFVVAENANVRAGAGTGHAVLGTVPQMSQVLVVGREGSWSRIHTTVEGRQLDGFISARLLHEGDGVGARAVVCDVAGSGRPGTGEVLLRRGYGSHQLTVRAGASDVLVKLRNADATVLAFFVRAGGAATISDVPDGTYRIMFAFGEGFSRSCLEFVNSMKVISDPSPLSFWVTSDGYAQYSSTATYSLQNQVGGNFRPQTDDAAEFRE